MKPNNQKRINKKMVIESFWPDHRVTVNNKLVITSFIETCKNIEDGRKIRYSVNPKFNIKI